MNAERNVHFMDPNPNTPKHLHDQRQHGRFFSQTKISREMLRILQTYNLLTPLPLVIEPYVGEGALIEPLLEKYPQIHGIGNDINPTVIHALQNKINASDTFQWRFTNLDVVQRPIDELLDAWHLVSAMSSPLLFLTNPPFGTTTTNKLSSKRTELEPKARKIQIQYGGMDAIYGKGDLMLPAIGKLIEIIKVLSNNAQKLGVYLAFFAPLGLFCGRTRYNKLLGGLLRDFRYIGGEIFAGDLFERVSRAKPIAFTIWAYQPGITTPHSSLSFKFEDKTIPLQIRPLLKEGWCYDERTNTQNALAVAHCDCFNVQQPKMFHTAYSRGGSEVISENVKRPLNVPPYPDELLYALWSIAVGYRSLSNYPLYMDNAYVHLPDFTLPLTQEILTYAIVQATIVETQHNYTSHKIGFYANPLSRINSHEKCAFPTFQFGSPQMTKACLLLLEKYGHCTLQDHITLWDVFTQLAAHPDVAHVDKHWRTWLRKEVNQRLAALQYWNAIPIPSIIFN